MELKHTKDGKTILIMDEPGYVSVIGGGGSKSKQVDPYQYGLLLPAGEHELTLTGNGENG